MPTPLPAPHAEADVGDPSPASPAPALPDLGEPFLDASELLEQGPTTLLLLFEQPAMRLDGVVVSDDAALAAELEKTAPKRVLVVTDRAVPETRRVEVIVLLREHHVQDIALLAAARPRRSRAERPNRPEGYPVITYSQWDCSFPKKADEDKVDEGHALVLVRVGSDGRALTVTVTEHSGHGFAAAAVACALSQRFSPALNAAGEPVEANTPPIMVRFVR